MQLARSPRSAPARRPARLPAPLRAELARRAAALLADLGAAATTADVVELETLPPGEAGAEPTARVVLSVAVLGRPGRDATVTPEVRLARAARALVPDGHLVLVEPYRRPGWRGLVADLLARPVRARWGVRPGLPVPALVRAAGFVISSIERFDMPTPVLPLRPFCQIVAQLPGAGAEGGR